MTKSSWAGIWGWGNRDRRLFSSCAWASERDRRQVYSMAAIWRICTPSSKTLYWSESFGASRTTTYTQADLQPGFLCPFQVHRCCIVSTLTASEWYYYSGISTNSRDDLDDGQQNIVIWNNLYSSIPRFILLRSQGISHVLPQILNYFEHNIGKKVQFKIVDFKKNGVVVFVFSLFSIWSTLIRLF